MVLIQRNGTLKETFNTDPYFPFMVVKLEKCRISHIDRSYCKVMGYFFMYDLIIVTDMESTITDN